MASVLPASPVDRTSDRPAYKQVADRLRERLDAGELSAGDRLPSETDLINEFGVSRSTVRDGLKQLINEGRAEALRGKGVFVREPASPTRFVYRDPMRMLTAGKYGEERHALAHDARAQGFGFRQELVGLEEVVADDDVARAFDVDPGTHVFVRRRLVWLKAPGARRFEVAKLVDSYYPLEVATPLVRQRDGKVHHVHGRIADAGFEPTRYTERVLFRMPTPHEAKRLRLIAGVPIIEQLRVASVDQRPVECLIGIAAGDKYELEYRISAQ